MSSEITSFNIRVYGIVLTHIAVIFGRRVKV